MFLSSVVAYFNFSKENIQLQNQLEKSEISIVYFIVFH